MLETIKNQKELLGCGEFENITTAATLELSSANDLEGERYRLVHEILLPLIHSLSECYKILDQLPCLVSCLLGPPEDMSFKDIAN